MARQTLGPLGHTSGKIAHLVYFQKNDNGFVRLAPQKKAAPSSAQLEINTQFALIQGFLGKVSGFIAKGFESKTPGTTPFNEAFRVNRKEAITGTMPDLAIDYSKVRLTNGSKVNPPSAYSVSASGTTVTFSWHYSTAAVNELGDDSFSVVVYNPAKDIVLQFNGLASREAGSVSVELPPDFNGDELLTWSCFQDKNLTQVSKSSFASVIISQ